jgi:hypothetical protein
MEIFSTMGYPRKMGQIKIFGESFKEIYWFGSKFTWEIDLKFREKIHKILFQSQNGHILEPLPQSNSPTIGFYCPWDFQRYLINTSEPFSQLTSPDNPSKPHNNDPNPDIGLKNIQESVLCKRIEPVSFIMTPARQIMPNCWTVISKNQINTEYPFSMFVSFQRTTLCGSRLWSRYIARESKHGFTVIFE